MKNMFLAGALCCLASAASAAVIAIDDFSTDSPLLSDTTDDGTAVTTGPTDIVVGSNTVSRTITLNLVDFIQPASATAQVTGGIFDITHGVGDLSVVTLSYGIDELEDDLLAAGDLSNLAVLVRVIRADANDVRIDADLNGENLGSFTLPAATVNTVLVFPVNPLGALNGTLTFEISGRPGYDTAISLLGFDTSGGSIVTPAPGVVALFGLGALALGLRSRRR